MAVPSRPDIVRNVPSVDHAPARLVVLASGAGSNLAALLAATDEPAFGAAVVAVGSDVAQAPALDRAGERGVPSFVEPLSAHPDRAAWDRALAEQVAAHAPDLVVCAGFMRILGPAFLERFAERIVNTHPALLPSFPGAHAVRDALAYGVRVTGVTVHLVDDGVDTGPVLDQRAVPVRDDDDEASLHARIKDVEHELLAEVVGRMVSDGWTVSGRKVTIP